MANQSTPYTTTATGTSWNASAGLPFSPGETFYVPLGENRAYPALPATGAFVTQSKVTNKGAVSKSPTLAVTPQYDNYRIGSLTTSFDPPLTATGSTSVPHDGASERWKNVDNFYDLTDVSFSAETMTITYYLDDPAEGAEGAEMMAMMAGGF